MGGVSICNLDWAGIYILKLYKHFDGLFHYHEAWVNDGEVHEHWGVVGERSDVQEHFLEPGTDETDAILSVLQAAGEKGFRPIDYENHHTLLIEYTVDGLGSSQDLDKRHALENVMNETLGWTGLGCCDGGSIGSGTMEVCCLVVDFDVAKHVIATELQGTEYSDFTRIYQE